MTIQLKHSSEPKSVDSLSQRSCLAYQKLIKMFNISPMGLRSKSILPKPNDVIWDGLSDFTHETNSVTPTYKKFIRSSKTQHLTFSTVAYKNQAKTSAKAPKSLIKKNNLQSVLTKQASKTSFLKKRSNKQIASLPKNPNLFCLISINRTKNNTHAVISNLFGENKTKWSISAGQFKLPGGRSGRRKTRLSQRMVYKSCLEKALSFGYKFTVIHCRGTRGSKTRIFRYFGNLLSILLIKDITGTPHNGCRPPKVRRV